MEKKLMPGSTRNAVAALRFLYDVTLQKDWLLEKIIPVPKHSGGKCPPPKTPEKRPCAPEDGIRKMASLTARNRLFHDIVPDFRDRPAMENRVRFSYASVACTYLFERSEQCLGASSSGRRASACKQFLGYDGAEVDTWSVFVV